MIFILNALHEDIIGLINEVLQVYANHGIKKGAILPPRDLKYSKGETHLVTW